MKRFSRPPNDPLYLRETSAYWTQFFYEECAQERQSLEERFNHLAAQITGTTEEHKARMEERKLIVNRYNELGKVLGLPAEDPEGEARAGHG